MSAPLPNEDVPGVAYVDCIRCGHRHPLCEDTKDELFHCIEKLRDERLRLRNALAGEVGLVQLVASCDSQPGKILKNHRHVEALSALLVSEKAGG